MTATPSSPISGRLAEGCAAASSNSDSRETASRPRSIASSGLPQTTSSGSRRRAISGMCFAFTSTLIVQ